MPKEKTISKSDKKSNLSTSQKFELDNKSEQALLEIYTTIREIKSEMKRNKSPTILKVLKKDLKYQENELKSITSKLKSYKLPVGSISRSSVNILNLKKQLYKESSPTIKNIIEKDLVK